MDLTNITSLMTKEQIVNICHSATTIPALIILFVAFIVFFTFWGLVLVKHNRGKILLILFLTTLCAGIVFIFLYINPNLTQSFAEWIRSLK